LNADTQEKYKEISKLEKKLESKADLENNLNDSIYPYSVALIVFCEEDVTGLGRSIGKSEDNKIRFKISLS